MRWTPVILLIVAIAIAVIVARGLPENLSNVSDDGGLRTPIDDAARAARPSTPSSEQRPPQPVDETRRDETN